MVREYSEFEITVQPNNGEAFPFFAYCPLGGDARGVLRLPSDDPTYQQLALRLSAFDTDEAALTQLGQMLFDALFQGPVKELYTRCQGQLKPGHALRLMLNIDIREVKVAVLPWEFLNDPDDGPLALRVASVVRYLPQPAPTPILKTELPLRVLLTGAQTPPQVDVTRELRTSSKPAAHSALKHHPISSARRTTSSSSKRWLASSAMS